MVCRRGGASSASEVNKGQDQALCGQCHANKTKTEPRPCTGILRSHFNKELWQSYVLSPKIPCLAYKDDGVKEYPFMNAPGRLPVNTSMAVDIVRSRYAALYNIPAPGLPIYTALDSIRPVIPDEELPDLIYIDKAFSCLLTTSPSPRD